MGLSARAERSAIAATAALTALTTTSPWWRRRRRAPRNLDAAAQALAPWTGLAALPLALIAAGRERRAAAATAGLTAVVGLGLLGWINGRPRRGQETSAAGTPTLRIAHFNLWYENRDPVAMASTIAAVQADVVTLRELTPELHHHLAAAGAPDAYDHRLERPGPFAAAAAIWANRPFVEVATANVGHQRLTVELDLAGMPVLIDAVHPLSPMAHAAEWHRDHVQLAREPAPDGRAAVMLGDFNSGWNHPGFRAIVARGWRDAHRDLGRGRSRSWRIDVPGLPPFVRLDHALVNDHLRVVDVEDIDLPGSDHRGLVVTVAPRRQAPTRPSDAPQR